MTRPDSPCIAICDTLYQDVCTGCGRHFTEVAQWGQMTDEQKDRVWQRIEAERTAKRFTTYTERARDAELRDKIHDEHRTGLDS